MAGGVRGVMRRRRTRGWRRTCVPTFANPSRDGRGMLISSRLYRTTTTLVRARRLPRRGRARPSRRARRMSRCVRLDFSCFRPLSSLEERLLILNLSVLLLPFARHAHAPPHRTPSLRHPLVPLSRPFLDSLCRSPSRHVLLWRSFDRTSFHASLAFALNRRGMPSATSPIALALDPALSRRPSALRRLATFRPTFARPLPPLRAPLHTHQLTQLEHVLKRPDTYIGSIEPVTQPMWVWDRESEKMVFRCVKPSLAFLSHG